MKKNEHNVVGISTLNGKPPVHAIETFTTKRFWGLITVEHHRTACGRAFVNTDQINTVQAPSPIFASLVTCKRCRIVLGLSTDKAEPPTAPMFDGSGLPVREFEVTTVPLNTEGPSALAGGE